MVMIQRSMKLEKGGRIEGIGYILTNKFRNVPIHLKAKRWVSSVILPHSEIIRCRRKEKGEVSVLRKGIID